MITAPKNTLAYQLKGRPMLLHRNLSATPCKLVGERLKKFLDTDTEKSTRPEVEALWFYLMNQAVAAVRAKYDLFEPLPPDVMWVMDTYHARMAPRVQRAFYYLLLICTREARHLHNKAALQSDLVSKFGQTVFDYVCTINDEASTAMKQFSQNPPAAELGPYCWALSYVFYKGKWSTAYGGKKWGVIADCLAKFVDGTTNAEMMMDTVWTLKHNTAPIFNKGMLYANDSSVLQRILDVQHSGQIPQMIACAAQGVGPYLTPELIEARKRLEEVFGPSFGGAFNVQKASDDAAKATKHFKHLYDEDDEDDQSETAPAKVKTDQFLVFPKAKYKPAVTVQKIKMPRKAAA